MDFDMVFRIFIFDPKLGFCKRYSLCKKSPKPFQNNSLTGGQNLHLVIDTKEYKFIVKQRYLTFSL